MVLRSEILVNKNVLPTKEQALPGRETPMTVPEKPSSTTPRRSARSSTDVDFAIFGLGCFWGAERGFWQREAWSARSWVTLAAFTPNPTYEEVCSGLTGHSEVVLVGLRAGKSQLPELLKMFWGTAQPDPGHAPGQHIGTQYRSVIDATNPSNWPPPSKASRCSRPS